MIQKEKDLLLKDLCARLPYRVKCLVNYTFCVKSSTVDTLIAINQQTEKYFFDWLCEWFNVDDFKPYLFPMSSVTEEQKSEFFDHFVKLELKYLNGEIKHSEIAQFEIDFYNKKHLDYRGLISKGLALDATNLNIY